MGCATGRASPLTVSDGAGIGDSRGRQKYVRITSHNNVLPNLRFRVLTLRNRSIKHGGDRRNLRGRLGRGGGDCRAGSRVQGTETKPEITVIGVDGSDGPAPRSTSTGAAVPHVWQFSDNIIDLDLIRGGLQDFADSKLIANYAGQVTGLSLAAKRAGKVAMVVGCQVVWCSSRSGKTTTREQPTELDDQSTGHDRIRISRQGSPHREPSL